MNPRARLAGLTMIIVVLCTLGYALVTPGIAWPVLGLVCVAANLLMHGIAGRETLMLPRWIVVVIAIAVVAWGVSRALSGFKIDALCECVLALMYLKIWDRRSPSDYAQLLTLSVYLAIGCTIRGEFGPVVVTALAAPVVLMATMLHQVYAGRQRFNKSDASEDHVWWSSYSFFGLFVAGLVSIGICAGTVFVLMPRGPLTAETGLLRSSASWVSRMGGLGRVTGFNDRIVLGQGGLISESRAAIAEVRVLTGDDGVVRPMDVVYLRGAVLEHYANGAWVAHDPDLPVPELQVVEMHGGTAITIAGMPRTPAPWKSVHLQVLLYEAGVVPVFAPWWPAKIEFGSADTLSLDRRTLVMKRVGQERAFTYNVAGYIGTTADPAALTRSPSERPSVSFPVASVREYAATVLRRAGVEPDPARRMPIEDGRAARAIEAHLRREFRYTLSILPAPRDRDPIDWFLHDGRAGHCEYFASAMTAMCRSVGIPARVVVGYVAAEQSGAGSFIVRQSNAHAWVEAAVDDFPSPVGSEEGARDPSLWHAWRTFDPTPPGDFSRIHQPEPTISLRFGRLLSSLENAWSANVLRFDDRKQSGVLGTREGSVSWVESKVLALAGQFSSEHKSLRESLGLGDPLKAAALVSGVAAAALSFMWFRRWFRRGRARAMTIARRGIDPRCARIRDRYCDLMRRAGMPRSDTETLGVHLRRVQPTLDARGDNALLLARQCVEALYLAQFAGEAGQRGVPAAELACEGLRRVLRSEKR